MQPASDHAPEPDAPKARCRFMLPAGADEDWFFDVPDDLEQCVGKYARITEFARDGHLLKISRQAGQPMS